METGIRHEGKPNILGAGLAGLSAAITLARQGIASNLLSLYPSERAQSVLAEGGINGALNVMGEDDTVENHRADTMRAGGRLADPEAVAGLTAHAPEIIRELSALGAPFNAGPDDELIQRNFGGQKKKRTAYAKGSTGKIIMSAMIAEARKYEEQGLIARYCHHEFLMLLLKKADAAAGAETPAKAAADSDAPASGTICCGILVRDTYTDERHSFFGPVILATGGINGVFPEMTTGTTANSGDVTAKLFEQGVRLGNLEMIQYHPTTIGITGKRCLVTEAARGEGGRLYIEKNGQKWYFMEEKFPEYGNLMPRDVVSREMYFVLHDPDCGDQVYLDMTDLPQAEVVWKERLPDLREEILHYTQLDPKTEPIPVDPGIHYFMGGIDVDARHRTNIGNLYAAGECCLQYHGANRLGANSMLGAIYGGKVAAGDLAARLQKQDDGAGDSVKTAAGKGAGRKAPDEAAGSSQAGQKDPTGTGWSAAPFADLDPQALAKLPEPDIREASPQLILQIRDILLDAMGIVRNADAIAESLRRIDALAAAPDLNAREKNRLHLAKAMLLSADIRKESRGAHYRLDYPKTDEAYQHETLADYTKDGAKVTLDKR